METESPRLLKTIAAAAAAEALAIAPTDLLPWAIEMIDTGGVKEIFTALRSRKRLGDLSADTPGIVSLCAKHKAHGIYVFAREKNTSEALTTSRNFLPPIGIREESATGTASVSLASHLFRQGVERSLYIFEQGDFLDEPSRIEVTLKTSGRGGNPLGDPRWRGTTDRHPRSHARHRKR